MTPPLSRFRWFAAFIIAWLLASPLSSRAEEKAGLRLLCWTEYVPESITKGFTREFGAPVSLETYSSNEEMLAKLRAHPAYYDVVQPSGYYVRQLVEAGGLTPLRAERIPNLVQLDPRLRSLPFDPENRFSIPWMAGTVGLIVDTRATPLRPERYSDLFSGDFAGKLVVVDDPREMVAWALTDVGRPITDVSEEALAAVRPVLLRWLRQVAVFDSDTPGRALESGRAVAGIIWSGEAAALWAKDHRFQYRLPRIGAHRFVDNLAIPANAPHRELAEDFLNYVLRPEVSVQISRAYPYTNPNLGARHLLTAGELANPASYPPGDPDLPMLRNDGNSTERVLSFFAEVKKEAGLSGGK